MTLVNKTRVVEICFAGRMVNSRWSVCLFCNGVGSRAVVTDFLFADPTFNVATSGPINDRDRPRLVFVQILLRNVVFRHFVRPNFLFVVIVGSFYAHHCISFERVAFLDQFIHTLGIRIFDVR
jgi:hypothetical protein